MSKLYADNKIFHFSDKLGDIAAGRVTAPVHVRLKPTNRCQHKCHYCCYRNSHLFLNERFNEADEIPTDKMREITADLVSTGVRAVTLSGGGEPLCYPGIEETIRVLTDGGVKLAVLTNGGLLKDDIAGLLAGRATWVRVSMDAADAESYARTRSVPVGEFGEVCDNIRAFTGMAGRKSVLGINFIITKDNSGDVLSFLEMAKGLGVDHVKVSNAIVSTEPSENTDYMAGFFDDVKRQIREADERLTDDTFAVIDKFHSDAESLVRDYDCCPMAQFLTVIAADQNLYTCQDKAYTTSGLLGSIKDSSFAGLWGSDALQARLKELNPSKECRHHCVAHGKNLSLHSYLEADQEHLDFV
ncbi:MAG: radical SAM protein [Kiritimatiellia bacterium]|jgi:MoaA/NifB/PqqE/SkfB family radical SAM enzyme|nr:radical SAM protein [Kiritimatiellia bacterium]MDP6849198.1 radical SAM protein [Kiritimatiellia bacterium]